jgi:D-alanyl-D-alanine dipeptidase
MALVSITPESHKVQIRLAYASSDNFTGRPVYARADCYLHEAAERLLRRAVDLAAAMGLGVLIFDAFRPSEAQWALWNHTPDPDFLADPRRGSPHSRGVAVDLTLTDNGAELDMGTAFDAFTPRSHHGSLEISPLAQRNRAILMGIMTSAGWDFYRNEWWHYQLFDARRLYPVLSDSVLPRPMMPQVSLLRAAE